MFAPKDAEVLVVGAGPVGMIAALALDHLGIEVMIVDKDEGPATHSYASALHSRTVEILNRLGVGVEAKKAGLPIHRVALYDGANRSAELDLTVLPASPFVLVLPQNELEDILAAELTRRGVNIQWHHRLAHCEGAHESVRATLERTSDTGKGYAVPHLDQVVTSRREVHASFLIGADGRDSTVGQQLGFEYRTFLPVDCYELYEFECSEAGDEIRIIFDEAGTSAFTPLPESHGRWIFQVSPEEIGWEAHLKDRRHLRVLSPRMDSEAGERLEQMASKRAPGFNASFKEFDWHATVDFPERIVRQFGRGRSWLLGDAAHLASPVGVQSMNLGMQEAFQLAEVISSIVRHGASVELLETFDNATRSEWEQILSNEELLTAGPRKSLWPRHLTNRLVRSLPASGEDLALLLRQIGLEFLPAKRAEKHPAYAR